MLAKSFTFQELFLWTLVSDVPILTIVLFTFRKNWRFGRRITLALALLLTAGLSISQSAIYFISDSRLLSLLDLADGALYILFFFLLLKVHPGKVLFVLFMSGNISHLVTTSGKYLEMQFFPDMAVQRYRCTYSLCILLIQAVIIPCLYVLVLRPTRDMLTEQDEADSFWRLAWLVPASFFVLWMVLLYFSGSTSLERMLQQSYVLFILFINITSLLICRLMLISVSKSLRNLQLQRMNYALSIQALQYDALQDQIAHVRVARHDLRHHVHLLQQMADGGDIPSIRSYLQDITGSQILESPVTYCENLTANAVLSFYAGEAEKNNIRYHVAVSLPAHLSLSSSDLAVLLGNLIENACEACSRQSTGERRIEISGEVTGESALVLTVDNTFDKPVNRTEGGRFLSSKHTGEGIGIYSVQNIVKRFGGISRFYEDGDVFRVSIYLPLPQVKPQGSL